MSRNIFLLLDKITTHDNIYCDVKRQKGAFMSTQSPQRIMRTFIKNFGRVRLSELFHQFQQGTDEKDLTHQYAMSIQQLSILKELLIQNPQKRKLG